MKPRSAIESDLFAAESRAPKIDSLGDRVAPRIVSATFVTSAHAADAAAAANESLGLYVGIGLGSSKLGPRHEGNDGPHGDRLEAAKIYGGYQLTDI
jgi:hypothetical protein